MNRRKALITLMVSIFAILVRPYQRGPRVQSSKEFLFVRERVLPKGGKWFAPPALKELDGRDIPACQNFDQSRVLGTAKVRYEKGVGCYARLTLNHPDHRISGNYPAIGFSTDQQDRCVYVHLLEPVMLGLCTNPNVDPEIPPLS